MKRISLIIFIWVALYQNIYSQNDFRKGYIITNEKDTINGLVDYREGNTKYKTCYFKLDENEDLTNYDSNQILGYRYIDDKVFVSKEVTKENNAKGNGFFEILTRGNVLLYRYFGTFYIQKEDEKLHELTNEPVKYYIDGKEYIKNSNRHIAVLSYLLSDCPSIKDKISKVKYSERQLTELIEAYNKCSGQASISFKEGKPWFKTHFGLSIGYNFSKLNFSSDLNNTEYLTSGFDYANSIMPGLYFDFLSPRIHERIAVHVGLAYLSSTYTSNSKIESYTNERNYITMDLEQLKIPLGFKYVFSEKNITPYINLGISSTIILESSFSWIQELENNNVVQTYDRESIFIDDNQLGFWGGIGIKKSIKNKLSGFIEMRYERTSGVSINIADSSLHDNITNFQILIGLSY
ncbi:outer membrane beta-barrel protein [Lutimonas halocynthiae]|uniref:outer membrane beta-barrel protein n=1 Tax=Lutimonas halocynthiae TaxID=1446477 RepID=UPI0025B3CE02|nr:outer membrane beta-barrel protein [Lutimonas halocynthiae]MDN3641854.1 outer membrane beta-barrel protein [Lutimonas halocynthiae]